MMAKGDLFNPPGSNAYKNPNHVMPKDRWHD
jgi:hypothetical protein